MKRRFTDADKWRDTWFLSLEPAERIAFLYILDACDPAGVWEPEWRVLRFCIGLDFDEAKLLEKMGPERVEILPGGKWWLRKFIAFQYTRLSETAPAHGQVWRHIRKHGIELRVEEAIPMASVSHRDGKKKKKNSIIGESRGGKPKRAAPFVPPSLEEVVAYGRERKSLVDPKGFFEHYALGNPPWTDVHGNQVRAWKQKFVTWERRETEKMKVPGIAPAKPRLPDNYQQILDRSKGGAHAPSE